MDSFLEIAKSMINNVSTACVTGGGAFKFEENFKNVRPKMNSNIRIDNISLSSRYHIQIHN